MLKATDKFSFLFAEELVQQHIWQTPKNAGEPVMIGSVVGA